MRGRDPLALALRYPLTLKEVFAIHRLVREHENRKPAKHGLSGARGPGSRPATTRPISPGYRRGAPLPFGAAVPSLKNRSSISAWIRYIHFSARAARSW